MTAGCVIDGSRRRRCCDRNEKENRQEKGNGVEVMLFGGRGGEGRECSSLRRLVSSTEKTEALRQARSGTAQVVVAKPDLSKSHGTCGAKLN